MFGFVDVVVACTHPKGKVVCQRTSNRIGNEDTYKAVNSEEAKLRRGEVVWCGGEEGGR